MLLNLVRIGCFCLCYVVGLTPIQAADGVRVFAASSLQGALDDIAHAYDAQSGQDVVLVYAASSSIARQVARGAPTDVVVFADEDWANWLVERGQIEAAIPIVSNRLIVMGLGVDPIDDATEIAEILGDSVLAMAQTGAVPAGRYGRAALEAAGLWGDLAPQIVQAANVRAALRFVERAEAPLGIGYASDLVALPRLSEVYRFAPDSYPKIIYAGGHVTDSGQDFMTYLSTQPAQDIFADWGFTPLGGDE